MTTLLSPELIQLDLKSTTKDATIQELAGLLMEDARIKDQATYLKAVFKREEEFSTGIGMGIAIPHGKSNSVRHSSVAYGRSIDGIDFDSMDGEPVHNVFLIAVPEDAGNEHLQLLGKLSRKLMHEDVRKSLEAASEPDEIIQVLGLNE